MRGEDRYYFSYYGQLANQQNMLQDNIRTSIYYKAITSVNLFNKIILDVGAGSGILSHFALGSGAKRVYAIEASDSIHAARILAENNGCFDKIQFIGKKLEDLENNEIEEKINVVISEPIGVFLFHERMFETFLEARDRFKPEVLLPCGGTLYLAPFSDAGLYGEVRGKVESFWSNKQFYGVDLNCLKNMAMDEAFSCPLIGNVDPNSLLTENYAKKYFDFTTIQIEDLLEIVIDVKMKSKYTGIIHGLAGWFTVNLTTQIVLSTFPSMPRTHWHQLKLLFPTPIALNKESMIDGKLIMRVNQHRSYDMELVLTLPFACKFYWKLNEQQFWNIYPTDSIPLPRQEHYNLY